MTHVHVPMTAARGLLSLAKSQNEHRLQGSPLLRRLQLYQLHGALVAGDCGENGRRRLSFASSPGRAHGMWDQRLTGRRPCPLPSRNPCHPPGVMAVEVKAREAAPVVLCPTTNLAE